MGWRGCRQSQQPVSARVREPRWQAHWSLKRWTVLAWGFKFDRRFPQDLCSSSETTKPGEYGLGVPQMRKLKKLTSKQANDPQGWLKAQGRLYWEMGLSGVSGVSGDGGHRRFSSCSLSTEYSLVIGKRFDPYNSIQKSRGMGWKSRGGEVRMETMTAVQARGVL